MRKNKLAQSKIVLLSTITWVFVGCNSAPTENTTPVTNTTEISNEVITYTPETLAKEISNIETELEKPGTPTKHEVRIKLVDFYYSYYKLFAGDKLSPDMLFKAGNQSVNLEKYQDALKYYSLVETKYSEYQKRPECIYLQGFIFDTYTNELGKAKEKYTVLLKRYPNHVLAEQAQISLNNLGKSDEELIRQFEKQNAN